MNVLRLSAVLHPGLILYGWALFAFLLQQSNAAQGLVIVGALAIIAWRLAPDSAGRLVRRCIPLLVLTVVLGLALTPGEKILPIAAWCPTHEGVVAAVTGVLRLLGLVLSVAVLSTALGRGRLLAGIEACLSPARRVGLDSRRFALRVLLTLELLEARPLRGWRAWLSDEFDDGIEPVVFEPVRWRVPDIVMVGCAAVLVGLWVGWP